MKYLHYIIIFCILYACGNEAPNLEKEPGTTVKNELPPKPHIEQIPFTPPPATPDSLIEESYTQQEELTPYKVKWIDDLDSLFPFYSKRVDSLLAKRMIFKKSIDFMYGSYDLLHRHEIKTLTPSELLYYCLAYPCSYYQNCNPWPDIDKGPKYFIYPMLPTPEDGHGLSELQRYHLTNNKDSISSLLEAYIDKNDTVALECLQLIQSQRMHKLIPVLCKKADFKKTPYCCTVLYCFMTEDKHPYKPFLSSAFYKRLQYDEWGRMEVKKSDLSELTKWAMKFYESKTK